MKVVEEIKRQLGLKPEITSIAPPYVVVNGTELLTEIEKLRENKIEEKVACLIYALLKDGVSVSSVEKATGYYKMRSKYPKSTSPLNINLEAYAKSLADNLLNSQLQKSNKSSVHDEDEEF